MAPTRRKIAQLKARMISKIAKAGAQVKMRSKLARFGAGPMPTPTAKIPNIVPWSFAYSQPRWRLVILTGADSAGVWPIG
jgi:hypothetical protein